MREGDYANASIILARAWQQAPSDVSISKDLALACYLQKDYRKALTVVKSLIDQNQADDQIYQMAGTIYRSSGQLKEAETLWKQTFEINETTEEPGINLASAECMLGEKEASMLTLKRVLSYSPDRKIARQKLKDIESGREF